MSAPTQSPLDPRDAPWWRDAVIYQVYPRSFADSDGDGIGDLVGIRQRLPELAELGVDAVWLSPVFRSPQRDAGYDVSDYCDIDPLFGTVADLDALIAEAHSLGLRIIADLVPNHTSSDHPWFQQALAAGPGSPERERYVFRPGRGDGSEPPNNWQSVFGGTMWDRVTEADGTLGDWYLHIFDSSQPDLNWDNPWVRDRFDEILRFWLDRGIDGFRVDVAHGLAKAVGLPDYTPPAEGGSMGADNADAALDAAPIDDGEGPAPSSDAEALQAPYWGQDAVHEVWRRWRTLTDEYPGERALCAEAWVMPLSYMAKWVRPDEYHQAFNFDYMFAPWTAAGQRAAVSRALRDFGAVGAPATWVLSNHDVIRHATRLGMDRPIPQGDGIGPRSDRVVDVAAGLARARAATAFLLGLPGAVYLYQGEELGLPEVIDLPDDARQDPTWARTAGATYGRDGCRVPIPWEADAPAYGFSPTGSSWLPQPDDWAPFARSAQRGVEGSTLELYRAALAARRSHQLGTGTLVWLDEAGSGVLRYRNGDVTVVTNFGRDAYRVDADRILLSSAELEVATDGSVTIGPDTTVWLRSS